MLYAHALTPGIFSRRNAGPNDRAAALYQLLTRISQFGLIEIPHKNPWISMVMGELVAQLGGSPKIGLALDKFEALVTQGRIVERQSGSAPPHGVDVDWLRCLIRCHESATFDFVVSERTSIDQEHPPEHHRDRFVAIEDLLLSPQWTEMKWEHLLKRSTNQTGDLLAPVLRSAASLKLIEPYLGIGILEGGRSERRWLKSLEKIDAGLNATRRMTSLSFVELHTLVDKKESVHDLESFNVEDHREGSVPKVAAALKQTLDRGTDVNLFLWGHGADEMIHNRYVLANHVGIGLRHGLDFSSTRRSTDDVTLLERSVHTKRWHDYSENAGVYQLKRKVVVEAG